MTKSTEAYRDRGGARQSGTVGRGHDKRRGHLRRRKRYGGANISTRVDIEDRGGHGVRDGCTVGIEGLKNTINLPGVKFCGKKNQFG